MQVMYPKSSRRTSLIGLSALLFFSSLIFTPLTAIPAHAGSNTITTMVSNPSMWYHPYDGGQYQWCSGWGGSASISSTFTTIFTWVPATGQTAQTDPPPSSVIVKQYAISESICTGGVGSANDGLGDSQVNTLMTPSNCTESVSEGTHYTVESGGASFTVACTISASDMAIGGDYSIWLVTGSASLTVTGGQTYNSGYYAETGSQITASVAASMPGYTVTGYTWSVNGQGLFTSFVGSDSVSNPGDGDFQGQSVLVGYSSSNSTGSSTSFCDCTNEDITIKCTVSLTNSSTGSTIAVETAPFVVTSVEPTLSSTSKVWYGQDGNIGGFTSNGGASLGARCVWNNTQITADEPFTSNGGYFCLVQEVTSCDFTEATLTSTYVLEWLDVFGQLRVPEDYLDNNYPYAGPWTTYGTTDDNPSIPLDFSTVNVVNGSMSFKDWIMFMPYGGANYVPIATSNWLWTGYFDSINPLSASGTCSASQWANVGGLGSFPIYSDTLINGGGWQ